MLTSIAIMILLGLILGSIFKKLNLPALLGYIIAGIILSPNASNLIDQSIVNIAADLRQIALVIILTRAGLSLNVEDLKKVGRPAVLMCFLPACFEMLGTYLLAPIVLGVSQLEALIIGSVIAAVSPAVIVPRMIKLIDEGYGKEHSIPQLILAGASVDDVFVIVVFTSVSALQLKLETGHGGKLSPLILAQIPVSIFSGIIVGIIAGLLLILLFKKLHMRDTTKLLITLSISFLFIELQNSLEGIFPVSGLLAIMSMGIIIKRNYEVLAVRMAVKYNKLWVGAEVILFVLVGATVDLVYVKKAGIVTVGLICFALVFRMAGVFICLIKTKLSLKERLFCMIAYTPKATVQAGIGAVPLAMGLLCGQTVLTAALISILLTAPFGAICIDKFYKKLLLK